MTGSWEEIRMGQAPAISVLMTARNPGLDLDRAARSLLAQTFKEWELVYVSDQSTDGSVERLEALGDPRIRILRTPRRMGLVPSVNWGIEATRAPLIARMDADDESDPTRLQKQFEFLATHPEHVLVGSFSRVVNARTERVSLSPRAVEDSAIRRAMGFVNPIVHGSVMIRKEALLRAGLYDETITARNGGSEDYELWTRLLREGKAHCIPEYLYTRYESPQGLTWNTALFAMIRRHLTLAARSIAWFSLPKWTYLKLVIPVVGFLLFRSGLLNKEWGHRLFARRSAA